MAKRGKVRIGGYSAMWGDVPWIPGQLIAGGQVDYLMGDYLAETTMAIMARQRAKDSKTGFARDVVELVATHAKALKDRQIKLVCNAGGMNCLGCQAAVKAVCKKAGVDLKVGVVMGDDITDRVPELRAKGCQEMYTGESMPDATFQSANAYFGAIPIARALAEGCDIIITGRVVDSALALGILMHEFSWPADDYDKLCMGTLAGHLIECSAQCTGGLFTDFEDVQWDNIGYPVVEVYPDGTFLLTKPPGTDGLISFATVAEQLCYEIGDPGAYHVPDVACDFTHVRIEEDEVTKDVVRISGGRGQPPTDTYKVCCTVPDGYAMILPILIAGHSAAAKARKTFETLLGRTQRTLKRMGWEDFKETHFEALGAGHFDPNVDERSATEVIGKVALKHSDARALRLFAREATCCGVSMAQGTTGFGATGLTGKASNVLRVFSITIPKKDLQCQVVLDDGRQVIVPVPVDGGFQASASSRVVPVPSMAPAGSTVSVPLRSLCWARSGDKGNTANVAIIARKPAYLPLLRHEVTAERVRAYFSRRVTGTCERYDLPGIHAMNFVLHGALGGGGMASLHSDPLAKTFGQILLLMTIAVPADWQLHGQPSARL